MCVRLVLLAHSTAFDVFSYELYKIWPPEFDGDKLMGFEITWVTSSLMVVATGKDRAAERVFWENVDMAFVGQDVVIILLVRQARPGGSRDTL